jgi:AcrR family transcriptional regulator
MARWEPHASERLAEAALELFAERGYENTTVLDIARRAGLAKSTFFRHFQDKRGVLFGEDALTERLATAVAAAPAVATPLDAVACGLDALGRDVFTPGRRAFTVRRRAVIDAHPDLREREALKGLSLTAAIARAVERRGAPVLVARVAAELGALALKIAYERWSVEGNGEEFAAIARRALDDVRAAALSASEPTPKPAPERAATPERTPAPTSTSD